MTRKGFLPDLIVILALAALPAVARAQEVPANTTTAGTQGAPAVASDAAGNFAVVWASAGQDGSDYGVVGRRFNAAGAPLGPEFQVNAYTSGRQSRASVSSDAAGNIVVVWSSTGQDGSGEGVFARQFSPAGAPLGDEITVTSTPAGDQDRPTVASDAAGNFVVVWTSSDGNGAGIFARRFSASGRPIGAEIGVNTTAVGDQDRADVAASASGTFVVAWASANQDGSGFGVFARRFDAAGTPVSPEFKVNTTVAGEQDRPSVASDAAGNFVVAWASAGQDGSGFGIVAQRFDAAGTPQGGEIAVNTTTAGEQDRPSVGMNDAGAFVIAWDSLGQDGAGTGVFARRFDPAGVPTGGETAVNTTTAGNQERPSAAFKTGFVIAWQGEDGSGPGVFARRFDP